MKNVCTNMDNVDFLDWVYERLMFVHNENPHSDYMIRLEQFITEFSKEQNQTKGETK